MSKRGGSAMQMGNSVLQELVTEASLISLQGCRVGGRKVEMPVFLITLLSGSDTAGYSGVGPGF